MLRVNSLFYIEKLWQQPTDIDSVKPNPVIIESRPPPTLEPETVEVEVVVEEEEEQDAASYTYNIDQVEIEINVPETMTDEPIQEEPKQESKRDSKMEEEEAPVVVIPTSISSASSIVPPVTPSSVHSTGHDIDKVSNRPRTTSLIRRETTKLNDRRKSLTLKLKKAFNKRNSV